MAPHGREHFLYPLCLPIVKPHIVAPTAVVLHPAEMRLTPVPQPRQCSHIHAEVPDADEMCLSVIRGLCPVPFIHPRAGSTSC